MEPAFTEEDAAKVTAKIDELAAMLRDIVGSDVDLAMIVHQKHAPDEECHGVKVLTTDKMVLGNLHNMIMNSMILIQSAMMQQAYDAAQTKH